MRQRNVKQKEEILKKSDYIVKNPSDYKGRWHEVFKNNNDIHLEIGTGKCKFIFEKAKKYPKINFIGLERSDSVLALFLKNNPEILPNLKLIYYDAKTISDLFSKEISVIYLNFSDPWPKERHAKRRLTHESFLKEYDKIFKDKKEIILKTDNQGLFEFSCISFSKYGYIIEDIKVDLHNCEINDNIMTEYEEKFSKRGSHILMVKVLKK